MGTKCEVALDAINKWAEKAQTQESEATLGLIKNLKLLNALGAPLEFNQAVLDGFPMKVATDGSKATPVLDTLPSQTEQRTMTYAGVGSRETPPDILKKMTTISGWLEKQGYTLNTGVTFKGKEEGADKAFSQGTKTKNLFGPDRVAVNSIEWKIAEELHPNFKALTKNWNGDPKSFKGAGAAKLMARNTNQVFGVNLDTPVDFVVFYAEETKNSLRPKGGTGQAVEMARRKGIPAINMAEEGWREKIISAVKDGPLAKTKEKSEVKKSVGAAKPKKQSSKPSPKVGDTIIFNGKKVTVQSITKEKGPYFNDPDGLLGDKRWDYELSNDESVLVYEGEGFYDVLEERELTSKEVQVEETQPGYRLYSINDEVSKAVTREEDDGTVLLDQVETEPSARNKGYSRQVINKVIEDYGNKTITLSAEPKAGITMKDLVKYYESFEFKVDTEIGKDKTAMTRSINEQVDSTQTDMIEAKYETEDDIMQEIKDKCKGK